MVPRRGWDDIVKSKFNNPWGSKLYAGYAVFEKFVPVLYRPESKGELLNVTFA